LTLILGVCPVPQFESLLGLQPYFNRGRGGTLELALQLEQVENRRIVLRHAVESQAKIPTPTVVPRSDSSCSAFAPLQWLEYSASHVLSLLRRSDQLRQSVKSAEERQLLDPQPGPPS